ncbi:MAG: hypothetical protein JWO58_508 [Chitinophagaceae bacterium]|nr:hypothetical protein [Chitinophagaceae bacterium]
MRVGKNPYKGINGEGKAYVGKKVTVAMLTFIPNFLGYYRERFDLLKLSIESLIKHTDSALADILVLDNGSCTEVRAYLQHLHDQGNIVFYVQSKYNLGYNGGLNWIYSACQSPYLSYSDDDVFFHPGWLEKAMEVHENFPSIGMVSCGPSKLKLSEHHEYSKALAEKYPDLVTSKRSPESWKEEWDQLFLKSVGSDISEFPKLNELEIPVLESNQVCCFPVSTHFHYVLSREAIELLYPFPVGDLMSSNIKNPEFNMLLVFDKVLDDGGLAKVTTCGMYTEHLGNVWSERAQLLKEQYQLHFEISAKEIHVKASSTWMQRIAFKFMNIPVIGKIPYRIYEAMFDLINAKNQFDRNKSTK